MLSIKSTTCLDPPRSFALAASARMRIASRSRPSTVQQVELGDDAFHLSNRSVVAYDIVVTQLQEAQLIDQDAYQDFNQREVSHENSEHTPERPRGRTVQRRTDAGPRWRAGVECVHTSCFQWVTDGSRAASD